MQRTVDRRDFLKASGAVAAGMALGGARLSAAPLTAGAPHAEKLGWRLGCQAWTFHQDTLFDAIDKVASLGLHYIEAFPGQRVSAAQSAKIGPGMSADLRKEVLKKLDDCGVRLVNFGVGGYDRANFEFAKQMGIETLTSEPKSDEDFDEIEKLCDEYGVNLAVHNHPQPSRYWNPDTVLRVCRGRGKRIGACADTGHWVRSGLVPLECLKKLEGRIISFHFKDVNERGPDAHDVPWGTGVCDAQALLAEIHRQGVKGVFSIEYEYNWGKSLHEIAQCVKFFDQQAALLVAQSGMAQ